MDLSVFPDEVRYEIDDNWREPIDFSIEEMLDMPVMEEVQVNLINMDCMGQNDLCKKESHCAELHGESFYITEKDLDCIDINDLY